MEDFKYFLRQGPYEPERDNRICLLHCRVGLPSNKRTLTAFSFLYGGLKDEINCSFIDLRNSKLYAMISENIGTKLEKVTRVEVDILDPQLVTTQKWEI